MPGEFAPVSQHGYQWPKWGQHYETSGQNGQPIDESSALELLTLYEDWRTAASLSDKERIWHRLLEINADQVYTLGLVALIPQPIVVSRLLNNVPQEAIFNWNPGAQFGIYRPDTFWFTRR